jgi:cytochrome b
LGWLKARFDPVGFITTTLRAKHFFQLHSAKNFETRFFMKTVRVWDLPTRLFHWSLAACFVGLVITGSVGGNAMLWHFRFGYAVFTLLLFRLVWGFVGGRWSRFGAFLYSPATILGFLRGQRRPEHATGHNPLGALSVFAMLAFLAAQVGSGLISDDEISFAGPLTRFVSNATVSLATTYHKDIGRLILFALVALHVVTVLLYLWKKQDNLIKPMVRGDKELPDDVVAKPSRDSSGSRFAGAIVLAACAAAVTWIVRLGG